ncbi:sensor histidine kinase [Frigoribacterium sp. PvP032]|uniref:sensor histidine kinase n=1 Tax=Frigoribacterium sp. PvP032 TaxID=2806589 RepID=UPI001AE9D6C7|nr:sensor histidine kinase [Frigoribacterium sp. PvP032]MBP1190917.1 MYXO-CTERM domain-containing protein [Frigoribacterium sp. PvP032]
MSALDCPADADETVWRRGTLTRRQARGDVWLAAGLLGLGLLTLWLASVAVEGSDVQAAAPPEALAWLVALCAPTALRRRAPVTVMVVVSAVFILSQLRSYPDSTAPSIIEFLVIYTANAWASSRRVAVIGSAVVTAAMLVWLGVAVLGPLQQGGPMLASTVAGVVYSFVLNLLFFVSAVWFGRSSRVSAARLHALERAGIDLRAAQELVAEQAIGEERTRIARELHDVVAHHVAVIAIQAGAARRTLDRPEVASGALSAVESTARTAIDELERLLTVLRAQDGTPHEGPTGLAALPQLVAETRRLGLDVRFSTHGERFDVPESVGVTLFRVVQEALTNTLKHASAGVADVRLRFRDRAVEVEVTDDGVGGAASSSPRGHAPAGTRGSGLGQRGMRERVDLHGGELHVGPHARGGYRVRAVLPAVRSTPVVDDAADAAAPDDSREARTR